MADDALTTRDLRALAEACDQGVPRWYDWQRLGEGPVTDPADIALITAMTPQRVVALVDELERARMRLSTLRNIAQTVAPALRAALGEDGDS